MFNIVLEKWNVVGVWYTYDQIILTGMDWSLCALHNFSDHVFLIIRQPGYWYQQPLSDIKKCQIAVCSSVANGTHRDPQWQPDTTGVVITPLQQIDIDNRGQPACRSLMGLGWGCPIDCIVRCNDGANGNILYFPHLVIIYKYTRSQFSRQLKWFMFVITGHVYLNALATKIYITIYSFYLAFYLL